MGKHFTKLEKSANNFTKFVEFANNFMKFVEFAYNFTKFVGLTKYFYEARRRCEQLNKVCGTRQQLLESPVKPTKTLWSLLIGRSDLSAWKFFFI